MKDKIISLYKNNREEVDGHQYTVPSNDSYPYQWLWDSCFHVVVLSHFDIESAKKELRSAVHKQFDSGLIPHITYWHKRDKLKFDWGIEGTSAITQPPIIAYALWRIYEKEKDIALLDEMYPSLDKYFRYLLSRDEDPPLNLINIINPDESGEDNSPRFDVPLGLLKKHTSGENNSKRFELFKRNKECNFEAASCMKQYFWVKDVPFNVFMIEGLEHLHEIALLLSKNDDAKFYKREANLIRDAMRAHMFEDGAYWSVYGDNLDKIRVHTWSVFAPLLIDLYSEEEAKVLVSKYLLEADTFWSHYPLPTVAMNDPSFDPLESPEGPPELHPTWRGPVWMATNWFLFRGLKRYGFDAEARHIAKKSRELIEKSGFREYFHPISGEGMGAHGFTWGGLILDMED